MVRLTHRNPVNDASICEAVVLVEDETTTARSGTDSGREVFIGGKGVDVAGEDVDVLYDLMNEGTAARRDLLGGEQERLKLPV